MQYIFIINKMQYTTNIRDQMVQWCILIICGIVIECLIPGKNDFLPSPVNWW